MTQRWRHPLEAIVNSALFDRHFSNKLYTLVQPISWSPLISMRHNLPGNLSSIINPATPDREFRAKLIALFNNSIELLSRLARALAFFNKSFRFVFLICSFFLIGLTSLFRNYGRCQVMPSKGSLLSRTIAC